MTGFLKVERLPRAPQEVIEDLLDVKELKSRHENGCKLYLAKAFPLKRSKFFQPGGVDAGAS